jgi:hypothetical protein
MIATDAGPPTPSGKPPPRPPRQEAFIGHAVATQHPAGVRRSHFNQRRAPLAVAQIALITLIAQTVAVVILAKDEDQPGEAISATPIGNINYGGFNPPPAGRGRPSAAYTGADPGEQHLLRRRPRGRHKGLRTLALQPARTRTGPGPDGPFALQHQQRQYN